MFNIPNCPHCGGEPSHIVEIAWVLYPLELEDLNPPEGGEGESKDYEYSVSEASEVCWDTSEPRRGDDGTLFAKCGQCCDIYNFKEKR